jgi:hypothetical protein
MDKLFDYIIPKGTLISETEILGVITGTLSFVKTDKGWMLPCTASKYITFTLPSLQQKAIITVTKVNNTYTVTQTNTTATITSLVLNNANYLRYIIYDSIASATTDKNNIQAWINRIQPLTLQQRLLEAPKPTELRESGLVAGYNKIRSGLHNDLSISGKHGVVTNCLSTVKGIKLHGVNSKVVYGNLGNVKSISFRIKLSTTTQPILEKASNSGLIHVSGGTLTSLDFATKYINGVEGTAMIANQWYNVTLTSATDVAFSATTLGLNNATYGNFEIEDLRFYNKVLSLQEIKAYHNSFNEVILHEKFEDMAVNNSKLPSGWIKNGGSFVCEEYFKKRGELVVNGEFDSATGWSISGESTISNGVARIYSSVGAASQISQSILNIGRRYRFNYTVISNPIQKLVLESANNLSLDCSIGGHTIDFTAIQTAFTLKRAGAGISCDVSIDNVSVIEIDTLPNFKNGTKYLRCVTAGIVAIPCKQAYGTTKANIFKVGNTVNDWLFTSTTIGAFNTTGQNGYLLRWDTDNKFKLYKITSGVLSAALITSTNTYTPAWYEPKVTRTTAGVFTIYINGISIGTTTDTTFNTSNYNQHSCIANDRIGEILIESL